MATAWPALAGAGELEVELTPFAAGVTGGEFDDQVTGAGVDVGSSSGFGIAVDIGAKGFDRQYELYYSRQATDVATDPRIDLEIEYLHIGGIVAYPQDHVTPYIVGGLGATRFAPSGGYDDDTKFSISLGGGVKVPLGKHLALRLEGRGYVTLVDTNAEFLCVSAQGNATCLIKASGNTFLQLAALAGLTFRF